MDKLISPSSPRPASFSFSEPSCAILELPSCEVPEQWLLADDVLVGKNENDDIGACLWEMPTDGALSPDSELAKLLPSLSAPAPQRPAKRRGRKPGPRPGTGAAAGHVESERQRREKLNRRFCDLRAAVPTVSKIDRASLLADATAYIAELRARAERLEIEVKVKQWGRWRPSMRSWRCGCWGSARRRRCA